MLTHTFASPFLGQMSIEQTTFSEVFCDIIAYTVFRHGFYFDDIGDDALYGEFSSRLNGLRKLVFSPLGDG